MPTYWVSNGCGALFIFSDVILDPSLDSTDAFEEWYILNEIEEKHTKSSVSCIQWGELKYKIEVVVATTPWKTEEPDYVEFKPK